MTPSIRLSVFATILATMLVCRPPGMDGEAWGQTPDAPGFNAPPLQGAAPDELTLRPLGEDIPDWKARWELARLLSYVKRYPEAIDAYRKVLKEKPDRPDITAELARVLFWSGQRDAALALFNRLPAESLDDTSRVIMADLLAYDKQYDRAAELYRKHLDNQPGHAAIRLRLAEVLSWAGKYTAASEEYRRLLAAAPGDSQIRRKYALVLSWLGRTDEAIVELKKTLP